MQQEDEPNPPVSLAMIQPRHAATVASVAAKARDLMCELALARATVKPRKAPKNKAIESAARAAAAASTSPQPVGPQSASSATGSAASAMSSAEGSSSDTPSDAVAAFGDDMFGSDSNDDSSSCSGHQDTSHEANTPRTVREEEERLLYVLQGPAAAEETLQMARARPAGCKVSAIPPGADTRGGSLSEVLSNGQSSPGAHITAAGNSNGGGSPVAGGSPRSLQPPPPPPPARTTSALAQYTAAQNSGYSPVGNAGQRLCQDAVRGGGGGRGGNLVAASGPLQTALSCPVTGLPEALGASSSPPASAHQGHGGASQHHSQSHRRNGGGQPPQQQQQQQQHLPGAGGHSGRRNNGAVRAPAGPAPPSAAVQQLLQQQQQLAVAQLYNNNAYGSLVALQGAYANAGGLASFGPPAPGRLDLNSMAATTAALELAAVQQVAAQQAAINAAAASGMYQLNQHIPFGGGFGAQPGGMSGLAQLTGGLASAGGLGGLGGTALVHQQPHHHHHHHQQAAAAAAAAALLQQGGGLMLADSMKAAHVGAGADPWSSVLLQAQLAGSLS